MLHLGNVSEDIIIHVAFFLDLDDLWSLRQVCARIRAVASSIPVWRIASSRLPLPVWSANPTTGSCYSSDSSGLPAFIQHTWRAAQIDRRWTAANLYSCFHGVVSQGWSSIRLTGRGQWIVCTNNRGDVAATKLVQAINQPIREQIIHHSPFVPAREWCGLVGWFRTLTVLIVQLESNLRSLNIHFCHLPPLDGSQPLDGLPPYKLNLPSHTTISTIEVCTSSRFLMLLCKDSDQHTGPARFLSVWSWGLGEDQAYHPPQYITRTVYFEASDCAFRIVQSRGSPHVFVVRANKGTTHFEFYDLQRHISHSGQIEPEAQVPVAHESLPWPCHQITLPHPSDIPLAGNLGDSSPISVVLCAARSPRRSELLGYRVCLHRDRELSIGLKKNDRSTPHDAAGINRTPRVCDRVQRGIDHFARGKPY
ncbi:hypothetical protein RSOLAG1IB_04225 [Rhizoctonia solani AG-1 IB]|uniref:F-box domain-containing protein n=1 Tax=Thanatephorus cucumeris (strain AG1-IB / isolate 7/3/14) TaxID=1108050 RepID=A0A0B7FSQ2_THACB|nr:hypothetical protein RSOLAG1IB_04225 [Rhizoctonia solani AG-1 IB]